MSKALVSKAIRAAHDSACWESTQIHVYFQPDKITTKKCSPHKKAAQALFRFSSPITGTLRQLLHPHPSKQSPQQCVEGSKQQIWAEILVNRGEGQGALLCASRNIFVSRLESSWLRILQSLHHEGSVVERGVKVRHAWLRLSLFDLGTRTAVKTFGDRFSWQRQCF